MAEFSAIPIQRQASEPAAPRRMPASGGRAALTASAFCLGIAFAAGILAVVYHREAGFAGLALLVGITVVGVGVLAAIAMRRPGSTARDRRARTLASAFEGFGDPLVVTRSDGTIVFANLSYRELCGGKTARLLQPELAIRPDSEMASRLYRLARTATEGGNATADIRTTEGDTAHWRRVTVESISRGRAEQRLTLWRFRPLADVTQGDLNDRGADIVPLVREVPAAAPVAEAAPQPIRESAFADLFAGAPAPMAMLEADGRIDIANEAFARFVKAEGPAGLKGRLIGDLIVNDDRSEVLRLIRSAFDSHASHAEVRFDGGGAGQIHAMAVKGDDGETAVAVHIVDLTNLKSIESQLFQSRKMAAVDQLAGGIAHDFNNTLTAIQGFADMLLLRHKAGDPSFADLMQIKNATTRAARMVGLLLAFSRQQTLTPKVCPVTDRLADISEMLKRLLTERIKLRHEFGRDLWNVRVDQAQFDNMIINLCVNARDAMPDGGALTIRTRNVSEADVRGQANAILTPADYVLIEVADTGTGIAPEILDKIFEPYFTTKEQGRGTGLGLAGVYGFVKQSGGFVFPESEVGKGTTFKIYLPRHVAAPEAPEVVAEPEAKKPAAAGRDLTGIGTILLVEDDDAVRGLTARALEMRGYEVLKANGGEEALEILTSVNKHIHLMVSDVVMPGMDGPEVAKAARAMRKDLKVIFMSGYAEDSFRKQAEMDEEVHFLPKPFQLNDLAAKVKDVMSSGSI
ncbi:MAG: response regulator [Alphaproteobacteria bacterium]|nr:response regulator [Alphaproteobacteria bacterium]